MDMKSILSLARQPAKNFCIAVYGIKIIWTMCSLLHCLRVFNLRTIVVDMLSCKSPLSTSGNDSYRITQGVKPYCAAPCVIWYLHLTVSLLFHHVHSVRITLCHLMVMFSVTDSCNVPSAL